MALNYIDLALILLVLACIHKYLTRNHEFFASRGIKYEKPVLLFGNLLGLFTQRDNAWTAFHKLYCKFKDEKVFGIFMFTRPVFMLKDTEAVKQITTQGFDHFVNRDKIFSENGDTIFAKSVFHLQDNLWREMRQTLSPIFTSSKMKTMFLHLTSCTDDLMEHFADTLSTKNRIVIDSKNIFGRYTAEAISTTALGFKGNCIKYENSQVFEIAQHIQSDLASGAGNLRQFLVTDFPRFSKFFNIKIFRKSTQDFFKKYVNDEIARRESKGIVKGNDVIQMLIEAKNGQLKDETLPENKIKISALNLKDEELITAQIFIFFAGGFETTSSLMQMCSWELAMNQDVQQELVREVDEVMETLNGKPVTYEILNKMKFLDMVVNESLRKWPPLSFTVRECNKDFKSITDDGKIIQFKVGDTILMPVRLIQHDPKYFANPSKFDPHRFSDENKANIVPGSLLAFGLGPRFCIGSRLAELEVKLVFFTILSKYSIEVCEKTPKEVNFSQSVMAYKEEIFVELKSRF